MKTSKAKVLMGLASFGALAQAALPGCAVPDTETESAEVGEAQQAAKTDTCRCYCSATKTQPYVVGLTAESKSYDLSWDFPKASSCPPAGDNKCTGYEMGSDKSMTSTLFDCSWVK